MTNPSLTEEVDEMFEAFRDNLTVYDTSLHTHVIDDKAVKEMLRDITEVILTRAIEAMPEAIKAGVDGDDLPIQADIWNEYRTEAIARLQALRGGV